MFGLGLVIYFCVSQGRHPFEEISSLDTCQGNIDRRTTSLSKSLLTKSLLNKNISAEAKDLVTHLLKVDPKQRSLSFSLF